MLAIQAATLLGDCLGCLFKKDEFHITAEDVTMVVMVLLRTVICVWLTGARGRVSRAAWPWSPTWSLS